MHVHAVPGRPQGPPGPDQGVVLDRLGQDQVAARAQDPTGLGQHPFRLLQVVEHVDAPHQADAGGGQRQSGAVGHRHRRLAQRLGGAGLVSLDADGPQAAGTHPAQPVAPTTTQVEHRALTAQFPEVALEPGVERLVEVGGCVLAGPGRPGRHPCSSGSGTRTRTLAKTIPARPETPNATPTHSAAPGSWVAGWPGAGEVVVLPPSGSTQAVGGPSPGREQVAGWAPAGDGTVNSTSNADAPTSRNATRASRDVRMETTSQTNLHGLPRLQSPHP